MRIFIVILAALITGVALGVAIGGLRHISSPCEALPSVNLTGETTPIAPPNAPVPKVAVDRLEYDFGPMDIEKSGRREFTVTNQGNATLKLVKGETTCRCAASDLEKTELLPGESAKITLKWRPTENLGTYRQTATFYTNDPEKPRLTIAITGKITASLRTKPDVFTFNRISVRETVPRSVALVSYLNSPLAIENPRFEENSLRNFFEITTNPLSDNTLKEYPDAKSGFLLTVTVKPGLPQGPFMQTITVTTNNPDKKEVAIPIEGSIGMEISVVGPGWDADHEVFFLGTVKSQEGLSRRVLLVVRGPYRREVQFKASEPPPVPLKVTVGEMAEVNGGQVTQTPLLIEIPKNSPQVSQLGQVKENGEDVPNASAVIELETTHPELPKFRIPVRFAVEK